MTETKTEAIEAESRSAADAWEPSTQNHDPSLWRVLREAYAEGYAAAIGKLCKSAKPIFLYEPASTDGYTSSGDGIYFLDETSAQGRANLRHGSYAVAPIRHYAIEDGKGRYYLLKQSRPVPIADSKQATEDIAKAARAKLSKEELKALGLE